MKYAIVSHLRLLIVCTIVCCSGGTKNLKRDSASIDNNDDTVHSSHEVDVVPTIALRNLRSPSLRRGKVVRNGEEEIKAAESRRRVIGEEEWNLDSEEEGIEVYVEGEEKTEEGDDNSKNDENYDDEEEEQDTDTDAIEVDILGSASTNSSYFLSAGDGIIFEEGWNIEDQDEGIDVYVEDMDRSEEFNGMDDEEGDEENALEVGASAEPFTVTLTDENSPAARISSKEILDANNIDVYVDDGDRTEEKFSFITTGGNSTEERYSSKVELDSEDQQEGIYVESREDADEGRTEGISEKEGKMEVDIVIGPALTNVSYAVVRVDENSKIDLSNLTFSSTGRATNEKSALEWARLDIAIFRWQSKEGSNIKIPPECNWMEYGVGAVNSDGQYEMCCSEVGIQSGLCSSSDYGTLIMNHHKYDGHHHTVALRANDEFERRVDNGAFSADESGTFILMFVSCHDGGRDIHVKGEMGLELERFSAAAPEKCCPLCGDVEMSLKPDLTPLQYMKLSRAANESFGLDDFSFQSKGKRDFQDLPANTQVQVEIAVFPLGRPSLDSPALCDWVDLGVGAVTPDGRTQYCCNDDAIDWELCNSQDRGRLIFNHSIYRGYQQLIELPSQGEFADNIPGDSEAAAWEDGSYIAVFSNCNGNGTEVMVSGRVSEENWITSADFTCGSTYASYHREDTRLILVAFVISASILECCTLKWRLRWKKKMVKEAAPIQNANIYPAKTCIV